MTPRPAFTGAQPKLILGIDIGTTFSGMSYCLLQPNEVPQIQPVTRFPGQGVVAGDSRIPSVILYDRDGRAQALGALCLDANVQNTAAQRGWTKASWFKLTMRPTSVTVSHPGFNIPPLPTDKTTVDVLADFLKYLLECARRFISETYPSGEAMWITLGSDMEFVLTHPNGWSGDEQQRLRRAAVMADLIRDNPTDHQRLHFVTEGEASLNFCIMNGLASQPLNSGEGVIIIDAGGGTVDISAYWKRENTFEEIAPTECIMNGSIFVTNNAEQYFQATLQDTPFANDIPVITERFDRGAKLTFHNPSESSYISFGGFRDNDESLDIEHGTLKLDGIDVAEFFQPSIDSIVEAVQRQRQQSKKPINSVFLTGGFSSSPWLFSELKRTFAPLGVQVSRPDSQRNKAVSDGAVSFYLDHFVSARIARETYGVICNAIYNDKDAEHRKRKHKSFVALDGYTRLPNNFSTILRKNTLVQEATEFRRDYSRSTKRLSELNNVEICIHRYTGPSAKPEWVDAEPDLYSPICVIRADTSKLAKKARAQRGPDGVFHRLEHDVVLSFGMTELTAQIAWMEQEDVDEGPRTIFAALSSWFSGPKSSERRTEKRGPAEILYEPVGV